MKCCNEVGSVRYTKRINWALYLCLLIRQKRGKLKTVLFPLMIHVCSHYWLMKKFNAWWIQFVSWLVIHMTPVKSSNTDCDCDWACFFSLIQHSTPSDRLKQSVLSCCLGFTSGQWAPANDIWGHGFGIAECLVMILIKINRRCEPNGTVPRGVA